MNHCDVKQVDGRTSTGRSTETQCDLSIGQVAIHQCKLDRLITTIDRYIITTKRTVMSATRQELYVSVRHPCMRVRGFLCGS